MDEETIKCKIEAALKILIENDKSLLIFDANERSITHMLALYLRDNFQGYDVDCEYNRNIDPDIIINPDLIFDAKTPAPNFIKRLNNKEFKGYKILQSTDTNGITIYPDIIIHKRCRKDKNLISIEVKKTTSVKKKDAFDIEKLNQYLYYSDLSYKYSLFIKIKTIPFEFLKDIIENDESYEIGISKLELRDRTDEKRWNIPSKLTANINKYVLKGLLGG